MYDLHRRLMLGMAWLWEKRKRLREGSYLDIYCLFLLFLVGVWSLSVLLLY